MSACSHTRTLKPNARECPVWVVGLAQRASIDCHQQFIRVREAPVAGKNVERRLAAIVSADVVGYSRLMGVDEAGTLQRLNAHRSELIDLKIAEHGGRIV